MLIFRVFGRLLWKELRESRLVILLTAASPLLLFHLAHINNLSSNLGQAYLALGWFISPAVVMLWAASKGGAKHDEKKLPLANLPAGRVVEWFASVGMPWAYAALAGAWYGLMLCSIGTGSGAGSNALTGAVGMAAGFGICYLVSAALSAWAGVIASFAWLIACSMAVTSTFARHSNNVDVVSGFFIRSLAAALACAALFLLFSHIKRRKTAQYASVVLLIGMVLGPMLSDVLVSLKPVEPNQASIPLSSPDRSLVVSISNVRVPKSMTELTLDDRRMGQTVRLTLKRHAQPIGFFGRDDVLIGQQLPDSDKVRILDWHIVRHKTRGHVINNSTTTVVDIPAGKLALSSTLYPTPELAFASPDGRYILLLLKSGVGDGKDVWVVDRLKRQAIIAMPNTLKSDHWMQPRVSWIRDKVALSGYELAAVIDLRILRARALEVPRGNGG